MEASSISEASLQALRTAHHPYLVSLSAWPPFALAMGAHNPYLVSQSAWPPFSLAMRAYNP